MLHPCPVVLLEGSTTPKLKKGVRSKWPTSNWLNALKTKAIVLLTAKESVSFLPTLFFLNTNGTERPCPFYKKMAIKEKRRPTNDGLPEFF